MSCVSFDSPLLDYHLFSGIWYKSKASIKGNVKASSRNLFLTGSFSPFLSSRLAHTLSQNYRHAHARLHSHPHFCKCMHTVHIVALFLILPLSTTNVCMWGSMQFKAHKYYIKHLHTQSQAQPRGIWSEPHRERCHSDRPDKPNECGVFCTTDRKTRHFCAYWATTCCCLFWVGECNYLAAMVLLISYTHSWKLFSMIFGGWVWDGEILCTLKVRNSLCSVQMCKHRYLCATISAFRELFWISSFQISNILQQKDTNLKNI